MHNSSEPITRGAMSKKVIVVCDLPKAGIGNQLFPLMKAFVFANLNQLPVLVLGYHAIKIGPYIRSEKSKRNYKKYFTFQKNILRERIEYLRLALINRKRKIEPDLEVLRHTLDSTVYHFSEIPHWSNYFHQLRDHRDIVIKLFWSILNPSLNVQLTSKPVPVIGVHIRMGDFRKLALDEDFRKVGTVRTPEHYFVDMISSIRRIHGSNLPVSVFTDGFIHEFESIFKLPDVQLIEGNTDIIDLLLLSRSKIIITSAGSTFSYWAGFLSDAIIIMHPDHIHQPIRSTEIYEGAFSETEKSMVNFIKAINI